MNRRGFSLLEVILAISIFAVFCSSVFYFYSSAMTSHEKFKRKYTELRLLREFVENFQSHEESGSQEKEGFVLEWQAQAVEAARKIESGEGVANQMQLKMVRVQIREKEKKNWLQELQFLYNEFVPSSLGLSSGNDRT